jgi:O-antigen ligase
LLRVDHKQTTNTSRALWIPVIWILIHNTKALGVWFGTSSLDMESGSPLDRAVLTILFCISLLFLVKKRFDWSISIKKNIWLLLLFGYMLVSVLWSDMPYVSFKRYFREVIAFIMPLVVIACEREPLKALQCILRRTIYIVIPFSYTLIHYFPEFGRLYTRWSGEQMWIGVTSQKNGLAELCLISSIFLIWSFVKRRQNNDSAVKYQSCLEILLLILTLWLMGGPNHSFAYSVTSNVAFIIGLLTLIFLFFMKKKFTTSGSKACIVISAFIIIYGTITPFIGKLSLFDISSTFGRDESLTGRSIIWTTLIQYVFQRPVFGFGFGGFWTEAMRQQTSSHAHNGYLDIILNIGFIGYMLFFIFWLLCCQRAQKMLIYNFEWAVLWISYLLIMFVHNIAESSMARLTNILPATILFLMIFSSIPRKLQVRNQIDT